MHVKPLLYLGKGKYLPRNTTAGRTTILQHAPIMAAQNQTNLKA
jgi:hypothetical protein